MSDEAFDASNPDHVVAKRQRIKVRQARIDTAMVALMENPNGRALVWGLLSDCGVFQSSFNPALPESMTFFNEGRRAIGLTILAHINRVAPDQYILMLKEGE